MPDTNRTSPTNQNTGSARPGPARPAPPARIGGPDQPGPDRPTLTVQQARQRIGKATGHAPSTPAMYRLLHDERIHWTKVIGRILVDQASVDQFIFNTSIGI